MAARTGAAQPAPRRVPTHVREGPVTEAFKGPYPEEEFDDVFILDNRVKKVGVDLGAMVGKLSFVARSGRRFATGPANRLSPLPRKINEWVSSQRNFSILLL